MRETGIDTGELRQSVAALIDEYMSLGVKLTQHQIFLQLVARGLLQDTPEDLENLQQAMPSLRASVNVVEHEREARLSQLKDAIREAAERIERGEPNLVEEVEAILARAFTEPLLQTS